MNIKLKKIVFTLFILVALGAATTISAKKVATPKMYIYGMSASFNDSIVYFTNVQELNNVWVENSHKELDVRHLYSQQLRNYLMTQGQTNRTCLVVAHKNRSKLEKKYLKMKKLYTQSKDGKVHFDVRYLNDQDFQFKTIDMTKVYEETKEIE
jgi:hypothetical protein